jgi:hypothetical protein
MIDLTQLANIAEIIGVMIVIGGLYFAVLQMRQIRRQRRELAAIELFRSFGSPQFSEAFRAVLSLPEGLSMTEIKERYPNREDAAMLISTTMENIGVMTFQRIIPFLVVSNLVGASTIVLWRKLARWAKDFRDELEEPNLFEWFQWLAEKLDDCQTCGQTPAYEAFRAWKPRSMTNEV